MENWGIALLTPLAVFLSLFLLSFLLNYLSSLYSGINLFKLNLKQRKKNKNWKKVIFLLKNGNLLFAVVCFFQVFLNIVMSQVFMEGMIENHFPDYWVSEYRWIAVILLSLSIALFTEIFVRYLVSRPSSKNRIFNPAFIFFAYLLVRIFYFLRVIVGPRRKIFSDSEKDIIRFIDNLTLDNTLEVGEASLVKSALNFDELKVSEILTPWKKVVCFNKDMTSNEIRKVHSRSFFARYPVLDQKKKIIGTFNIETFYWKLIIKEDETWQNCINKEIICFSPNEKLDKVLARLQRSNCRLAIIKEKKKIIGIVTLHDTLSALVGKIKEERKMLLLPRSLN